MNVTQVALCPTSASQDAGRPALTPELLAATGARYSRSNEGLNAILSRIDPNNLDKSVDSIFRMIDYGHASIADMSPVALFMDGISMWLAYHIWSLCPTAGGQESSTRYIKLSADNLPNAEEVGIPEALREEWQGAMQNAFAAYEKAVQFWENIAAKNPSVTRIAQSLLDDSSERAQKQVARMKRNYAFDRARYFLPAALKTNVMMVQSARAWVALCQNLLSHPLPEAQKLGELVREELALATPRLLKHAEAKASFQQGIEQENQETRAWAQNFVSDFGSDLKCCEDEARLFLPVGLPCPTEVAKDLQFHDNRYAYIGTQLRRLPLTFGWEAVAFGDIRDLNRHRTGNKFCPLAPRGFYSAADQTQEIIEELAQTGEKISSRALQLVADGDPTSIYWFLLGTQFYFEHTTTADKFIYEAELRTGVGAHYRYAKHLRDVLELWYQQFPATRGLILEGSAEPE